MRPPDAGKAGPATGPASTSAISASTKKLDRRKGSATTTSVVAFGTRYIAAGESLYDWVVVRRCPLCGFGHKHLLLGEHRTITSFERSPACAKHRKYTVTVTDVVPSPNARRQAA